MAHPSRRALRDRRRTAVVRGEPGPFVPELPTGRGRQCAPIPPLGVRRADSVVLLLPGTLVGVARRDVPPGLLGVEASCGCSQRGTPSRDSTPTIRPCSIWIACSAFGTATVACLMPLSPSACRRRHGSRGPNPPFRIGQKPASLRRASSFRGRRSDGSRCPWGTFRPAMSGNSEAPLIWK